MNLWTRSGYKVCLLLVVILLLVLGCQSAPAESPDEGPSADVDVVVELTAVNYAFSEETIVVQKGQRVRIELISEQGNHDWVVDEFDAATAIVGSGGNTSVEFVADQAGQFEYYCSVGSHRAQGMVGTLIVEE